MVSSASLKYNLLFDVMHNRLDPGYEPRLLNMQPLKSARSLEVQANFCTFFMVSGH